MDAKYTQSLIDEDRSQTDCAATSVQYNFKLEQSRALVSHTGPEL